MGFCPAGTIHFISFFFYLFQHKPCHHSSNIKFPSALSLLKLYILYFLPCLHFFNIDPVGIITNNHGHGQDKAALKSPLPMMFVQNSSI